jgi:hypothetical protein
MGVFLSAVPVFKQPLRSGLLLRRQAVTGQAWPVVVQSSRMRLSLFGLTELAVCV